MAGSIIHLIGFPGVGKLTIAKRIVARRADCLLVDNHLINNPIFSVVGANGGAPLPAGVWDSVAQVRDIVLGAICTLAPPHLNFVITNVMVEDDEDRQIGRQIEDVAHSKGGLYVPVALTCDAVENKRRITSEGRAARLKDVSPRTVDRMHAGPPLLRHEGNPHRIEVDVTSTPPDETALMILHHAMAVGAIGADEGGQIPSLEAR